MQNIIQDIVFIICAERQDEAGHRGLKAFHRVWGVLLLSIERLACRNCCRDVPIAISGGLGRQEAPVLVTDPPIPEGSGRVFWEPILRLEFCLGLSWFMPVPAVSERARKLVVEVLPSNFRELALVLVGPELMPKPRS